jgi:hypothetical protein
MIALTDEQEFGPTELKLPRHEGIRAGALGGSVVAAWLLINDSMSGTPLGTPTLLGRWILGLIVPGANLPPWADLLAFAIWHYAIWTGVAMLVLAVVHAAARTPSILIAGAQGFIIVQLADLGIATAVSQGPMGAMAWRALVFGNVFGWGATWLYVARRHPEVRAELARAVEHDEQ